MYRLLKIIILFSVFHGLVKAQVQDIFRYTPVYKFVNTEIDINEIQLISYNSNSRLKDLIDEEDFNSPLSVLEKYICASSVEEINSITLEKSEKWNLDKEKIKRTSLLYQTDSVEMHVSSQIIVEYENELYSYIRYSIDFKYESLIQDSRLNNFPALKIAVRKNNRWVLTRNSPMGARFKFAYYNCSANTVLELFKGTRLVNNQAIISNENIVDFDRLIIGMENDTVSDNTIEMISDTIKLSYSGKRETEQLSEYWINQLGTHPVNSDRSIEEYNQDQIKLFLAVHQAIIEYTSGTKESSISIRYDDLYLNDDLICKTHIIKYGYWDETNNTYVFRIERNGPYDIKSFSVYVTLADNEFILDFQSSENHFEYVDHISERLHSRLCSNRFNKDEKNVVLEELKSSCMERAVNHTVIDFECFSSFISQLSEEERDILKSIYK